MSRELLWRAGQSAAASAAADLPLLASGAPVSAAPTNKADVVRLAGLFGEAATATALRAVGADTVGSLTRAQYDPFVAALASDAWLEPTPCDEDEERSISLIRGCMAEREGFEPSRRSRA